MPSLPKPLEPDEQPGTLQQHEIQALWSGLTPKQQSWVQEYLSNGLNATQAVKDSEYASDDNASCRAIGHQNRTHPKIRPLIEHACRRHMSENEVLKRVSQIARASWEDFLRFTEDGRVEPDLQKARDRGKMHLVKNIKWDVTDDGQQYVKEIKLKDDQKAQDQLLKATGAYELEDAGTTIENLTLNQYNAQINEHMEGEDTRWPKVEPQE